MNVNVIFLLLICDFFVPTFKLSIELLGCKINALSGDCLFAQFILGTDTVEVCYLLLRRIPYSEDIVVGVIPTFLPRRWCVYLLLRTYQFKISLNSKDLVMSAPRVSSNLCGLASLTLEGSQLTTKNRKVSNKCGDGRWKFQPWSKLPGVYRRIQNKLECY